MYRNKYDNSDCAERGKSAEERFKLLLETKGINGYRMTVTYSTKIENINNHIDMWFESSKIPNKRFSADVKARKRLNRSDANLQDDLIWIELKNVQGKNGWLYGDADYIVFEIESGFLICPKDKLIAQIEKLKPKFFESNDNSKVPYKLYSRKNRKDLLVLIPIEEILPISFKLTSR